MKDTAAMKIIRSRRPAVGALSTLAVASLALAGCGSLVERVVERGVEASTGENVSIDTDVDGESGSFSIDTGDGNITIETDEDGGSHMTMEGDDGQTSFRSAPTTEVPPEIADLGVIPDGFVPATFHEQKTDEGHSTSLSGSISGRLSDLLDDIEERARSLGEPERFLMETGDGGGMGNIQVRRENGDSVVVSLLGDDPEELILQVMLLETE